MNVLQIEASVATNSLEDVLSEALLNPKLINLFGTWRIDNQRHPVDTYTINESHVLQSFESKDEHALSCCGGKGIYASQVVGVVQLPLSTFKLRDRRRPLYLNFIQEPGSKIILHKNGILKFVPVGGSILHKIALARLDSKSWWDLIKNLRHAQENTCFCLGILTKDGTIKRYNRWNTDVDYFYTSSQD